MHIIFAVGLRIGWSCSTGCLHNLQINNLSYLHMYMYVCQSHTELEDLNG